MSGGALPLPLRGRIENTRPFPRVALRSTRGYSPSPRWGGDELRCGCGRSSSFNQPPLAVDIETMPHSKLELYREHVAECRACRKCQDVDGACAGIPINPTGGGFEHHPSPWAEISGALPEILSAEIVVVGQDFAGASAGWLHPNPDAPTNECLLAMVGAAGLDAASTYFTNAMLCLKPGGMSARVRSAWLRNCEERLRRTIDIIRPRVVVALGAGARRSVCGAFDRPRSALDGRIGAAPLALAEGVHACAFGHPGRLGLRARSRDLQQQDWRGLARWLRTCRGAGAA